MSLFTEFLNLFCYNTKTDGKMTFNVKKSLTENFQKIDAFAKEISSASTQPDWSEENPESKGFIKNKPQAASEDKLGLVKIGAGINIEPDGTISAPSLPLFSTVTSDVPLADARLHLKDGSLLQGDGVYSDFVNEAKERYGDGSDIPDYFTDEETWQSEVAQYGVCAKYVYDPENNTLRLPKWGSEFLLQIPAQTAPVIGNGKTLGMSNGSVVGGFAGLNTNYHGAVTNINGRALSTTAPSSGVSMINGIIGVTTDPEKSGLIADLSSLNTIKAGVYYYVVVATEAKSEALANLDNIAADLNGKADRDGSNMTLAPAFSKILDSAGIRTVVEQYQNGNSWYRIYSDGWCEQGGQFSANNTAATTVTLLKKFKAADYYISLQLMNNANSYDLAVPTLKVDSFTTGTTATGGNRKWEAKGFLAEGEY